MLDKEVLRGKDDFSKVYRKGKSIGDRYVVLFYKKNNLSYNRIAFLASKKVGNSVKRNRARRLMKEAYRISDFQLKVGYDYIIIARATIDKTKCIDVKKSMYSAFKRAEVLIKNEINK